MKFASFIYRFLVWFIIVALLPLALFGYLSLQQNEAELRSETLNRMSRLADKKALEIKTYLAERSQDAQLLARSYQAEVAMSDLPRAYAHYRADSAEYRKAAKPFDKNLAAYIGEGRDTLFYDVFLITPQGEIVYTNKREADFATNLISGPYRDSQLAQVFRESCATLESSTSDFEHYSPSNIPAAFIAAPIIREGVLLGVVAFQLDTQRIYQIAMDSIGLGVTGETVLAKLTGAGEAVFVAPLRHDPQAAMQRKIDLKTAVVPVRHALFGQRGGGVEIDYAGKQVVAAWRYLPELRWGMVVKMDVDEAFAPIFKQRKSLFGALLALVALSGFAAFYLGRQMVTRLRSFVENADEIAQGDLSKRVDESGADEISALARSFNHMTGSLQSLYRTLEDRVEQRTRELKVSNEQLQREVIEREHAEADMLASRYQLEATIDAIPDLLFELGLDGTYHDIHAQRKDLLAAAAEELLGKRVVDVLPDEAAEVFMAALQEAHEQGYSHGKQFELPLPQGNSWFELSVSSKPAPPGQQPRFIALSRDITERKLAEEVLKGYKQILDFTSDGFWLADMMGNIVEANQAYANISGYSVKELMHMHISQVEAKEKSVEEVKAHIEKVIALGFDQFETRHRHKDGHEIDIEVSATFIQEMQQFSIFLRDITERKKMEESLRIAAATFETHEAIMIVDANANIIRVNQAFAEITGYQPEEVLGKNPRILSSGRQGKAFYAEMWRRLLNDGTWSGEIWDRRKSGQIYPKRMTITAIKNESGETTEYVAIFSDITAHKQAEEEIRSLAFYDALTLLPNRRLLMDRLRLALSVSARSHHYGAVLFLDMDKFKTLNDMLGHDYGDLLLIEVAQRIQSCVREMDTVARLGGDEFVVLIEEIDTNAGEASQKIALVAEKIRASLAEPYQLKNHECHSSPSIGVCLYRGNEESVEALLKHADLAMYQVKDAGRNAVRFFDPAMQQAVEAHAMLDMDLRRAVPGHQLRLHYQIQLDSERRPLGAEALVRWMRPKHGIILPAQFIPIAEESSLILDIGHWVLETACQQLALWGKREQTRNLVLSVNVSAQEFRLHDFVDRVAAVIRAHQVNPSRLKLELTESVVLDDVGNVVAKMHALKAMGVKFSLDDFGTGYSSLSYLKKLPLDQLKIDQSFVRDIATDINDAVMVKTIIDMAKNFRLNIIAEGVETEAQLAFLKENGCMAYQGYLFSKPVPIEEFEARLDGV